MMANGIDDAILGEAADWLMRFQCGEDTADTRRDFEHWRVRSPAHQAAWQRAESVLGAFGQVPSRLGRDTLRGLDAPPGRRRALHALGALFVAAPATWLAWRQLPWAEWRSDVRTATGEQKTLVLGDGTQLVLNTASAVDIAFSVAERRIRLHAGEILVTTGRDPSPTYRPFIVQTPQGTVRALGTRFQVRNEQGATRVAVFESAVEVRAPQAPHAVLIQAGEQLRFGSAGVSPIQPVQASAALWAQGMLAAQDMPLADLVAELGRYRRGVLRCHPALAGLRVSGAFPLLDTDASLRLLQKTLPLRVRRTSSYWVVLEPR